MKKKIALLLILALVFAVFATACGDNKEEKPSGKVEYATLPYSEYDLTQYVELPDYLSYTCDKVHVEVTEEDYKAAYAEVAAQFDTVQNVTEGIVALGDTVNIAFKGSLSDGSSPAGMSSDSYDLVIGSGAFIDGFETQLLGKQVGSEVTVNCTFPDPYPNNPDLAGQPAKFEVTINSKQVKVTHDDITEDMVAQTNYNSVEELKEAIRKQVIDNANEQALTTVKQDLVSKILEEVTIKEMPQEKIDEYVDLCDRIYKAFAQLQNADWDTFRENAFNVQGLTQEEYENQVLLEGAKNSVMQDLTMFAIAQKEGIKVETSEYQSYADYFIENMGCEDAQDFADFFGGITIDEYLQYTGIYKGLIADKIGQIIYDKNAK